MSESSPSVLRFNDCEFDPARRELRRNGEVVPLEPRVFALLLYLIEQRHRAVDKNEIQDAVWTGTIVSETALTRAIMKARRAVGDSADTQSVIRTVHGHGYQFIATLATEATPAATPQHQSSPMRPRVFAVAIAIALLGFIAYLWPGKPPTDAVHLAIMPVENLTGDNEYDWTRLGLMGFASDLVTQSSELSVMRSSDVIRFVETNGLPDPESADADLNELRDIYGASHLLLTHLERSAGTLRLSYSLHAGGGEVERGTMVGAEPTSLLRGMIHNVTSMLGGRTGTNREITVIAEDAFINEAYSRGRAFALEGRCEDALQLFEVVRQPPTRSLLRNTNGQTAHASSGARKMPRPRSSRYWRHCRKSPQRHCGRWPTTASVPCTYAAAALMPRMRRCKRASSLHNRPATGLWRA